MDLKQYIRDFPDFPKPGILFKDISPILKSSEAMAYVEERIYQHFKDRKIDLVAGAESRGLMFASALAERFEKGLIMVRKQGKLPGPTKSVAYDIEYGSAVMEIQEDAVAPGQRVLMVDDLLATGGTASAASQLIESAGGFVVGHAFVIELSFLQGRDQLKNYEILTLVNYEE
ncbi:MAG: adenine phosphoribosyltransferase [Gammaproteobacteria bacterium]|nr:adenine phosphoribosyltransferase [Gammaproteobacteria bacterium]MBU1559061.1 adenine phosphoribosyltransferase [Gammaproteobacteria bacterium]MBU1926918.1 adenine phosphoribosyltransferase [Gammaproteobacteria bacterium]MBU2546693.1 adenine phosphoribosyltransferase [Gammaproteobacteria bacterium]